MMWDHSIKLSINATAIKTRGINKISRKDPSETKLFINSETSFSQLEMESETKQTQQ